MIKLKFIFIMFDRFITLIDMDCFYCQVEARLNPSLQGKPIAVVQYQTWKGGGIIAVNYEARNLGVTRRMRGVDAKKHCPEIELVSVPDVRGKADLTKYRDAGREVIAVLNEFSPCVEKASIDEAYLDLTEIVEKQCIKVKPEDLKNTFIVGYPDDKGVSQWLDDLYNGGMNDKNLLKLAQATALVEEIRAAVYERTGFRCSAGISHNKILAKLSCGLHKPNKQTVLPFTSIPILYETLPVQKIRSLGGKFGDSVKEQLNCSTMSEVAKFSLKELMQKFGEKSGNWLYNIARGIDNEPVKSRIVSKSIGCCKNFPAHTSLTSKKDVKHWLGELADEVYERIQTDLVTNKRRATLLTVSAHYEDKGKPVVFSRSTTLHNYSAEEIVNNSLILLSKSNTAPQKSEAWIPALTFLGMSVGKFIEVKDASSSLLNFFKPIKSKETNDEIESPTLFNTDPESTRNSPSPNSHLIIFTNNISDLSKRLQEPEPDYQNPVPSTSKEPTPPPQLDYNNSFFCNYFKNKTLYVPVRYDEPYNKADGSEELDISVGTFDGNDTNESNHSEKVSEIMERCADCHKLIPLVDFLEHLDHHAALKLQRELNREEMAINRAEMNVQVQTKVSEKRKYKKLKTKEKDSPAKKHQPITAFFSVKPSN